MSPLAFAWRSLTQKPARAGLGVAGITVVGALLLDMLLLSRGLAVSFERLLDTAGFDVRVTATESLPGSGPWIEHGVAALREIEAVAEVDEAVGFRFGGAETVAEPKVEIRMIGSTGPARDTWRNVAGRDLRFDETGGEPEIVVSSALAETLDLAPGATLRLRGACADEASALPPVDFRVAGVVEFLFDSSAGATALIRLDRLAAACDLAEPDALDLLLVASRHGVASADAVLAVRAARPDLHVFSNRELVDRLETSNFSYFRQVSLALSLVTVFFAFLLTTTMLTVSVNQRLGEVAGLRALGFGRSRVAADLICESALLVGTGTLLSLPLGGLFALWLDAILREMPGLPARLHFFVWEPRVVALHATLLVATGGAAALYPAWLAATLPIAATLRKETVS